jgi:hypothetical protein
MVSRRPRVEVAGAFLKLRENIRKLEQAIQRIHAFG